MGKKLLICILVALDLFLFIWIFETKEVEKNVMLKSSSTTVYQNIVALSFDDGPHSRYTKELLDGLKERGVVASFFIVGERIEGNEELVKRMYDEGHLIGNHTFSHINLDKISIECAKKEVSRTNNLIEEITGEPVKFIRPPYGEFSEKLEAQIDLSEVLWSVDPQDWNTNSVDRVVNHVVRNVKDGDIILLHDIYPSSVAAALRIVDELKNRGYIFVTVDEILID